MPLTKEGPRLILRGLRELMAAGGEPQSRLDQTVDLIATSMEAAVCSVYLRRAHNTLELCASCGLNREAVHKTQLPIGEGLVGDIAAHKRPLNLVRPETHPGYVYRPETGEEKYMSFVGVPILRGGYVLGVLVVQNITQRQFVSEELEALETVAMVLAEMLAAAGDIEATPLRARNAPHEFNGIGLVDGIAIGQVVLHAPRVEVARLISDDSEAELARLERAVYQLRRNVDAMLTTEDVSHAGEHLEVLETYRLFANDSGWLARIQNAIRTGLTADAGVMRVNDDMRARIGNQRDAYLRARLYDFDDLSNRLLRILSGRAALASKTKLPRNAILLARMMGPAELLDYDRRKLRGLVLEEGAAGAHVAIVARALGIALIGNVRGLREIAYDGQHIVMDGAQGVGHVNPASDIVETYAHRAREQARLQKNYARLRHRAAVSRDGVHVRLDMNAGLDVDVERLESSGADNIGLFRTELQFMVSAHLPRLQEQQNFYTQILQKAGARDVVFRTLDIGGDKVLPYLTPHTEDNPAMGWRALRMSLDRQALLRYQLRALLRAAAGKRLSVMFPLVTTRAEFMAARQLLEKERALAQKLGHKIADSIAVGTMLEVPALVWELEHLLPEVDFVSIGTNDLMQFLFAADRGNPRLVGRYDMLSYPALRLLAHVQNLCQAQGTPVSLCGELGELGTKSGGPKLGGGTLEAMVLLGLGFTRFSVPALAVGPIKRMVRSVHLRRLREGVESIMLTPPENLRAAFHQLAQQQGIKL